MPTRKRSKTTRNRKTRRYHMRPMRHIRPMKNLSIPLGYFGSIQINRRSDNGIDLIFNLGKKVHGGAKLSNSSDSIRLIQTIMDAGARRTIEQNIRNVLIPFFPTLVNGYRTYYRTFQDGNRKRHGIHIRNDNEHTEFPLHISMFETVPIYDQHFHLQPTRQRSGKYHITYGNNRDGGNQNVHFPLEWHIVYDEDANNFYLRCVLNPTQYPHGYNRIQIQAIEAMVEAIRAMVDLMNTTLRRDDNRISAINIQNRDDTIAGLINDRSRYRINDYPNLVTDRRQLALNIERSNNNYTAEQTRRERLEAAEQTRREEEEQLAQHEEQLASAEQAERAHLLREEIGRLENEAITVQRDIDEVYQIENIEERLRRINDLGYDLDWDSSPQSRMQEINTRINDIRRQLDRPVNPAI